MVDKIKPFGLEPEEMELARECAKKAVEKYGDDVGEQFQKIMRGEIWNDHVAVQAAVETIKALKNGKR
jgi:hypothetical protein